MSRLALMAALVAALGVAVGGCAGQPSAACPAGAWHIAYTGYGTVHRGSGSACAAFTLLPARAAAATVSHSALVLSARSLTGFTLVVRLRTDRQLRSPGPHEWEVGWLLWHYADDRHFYYLILKPNGFELGQENPAYPGQQRFLVTGSTPAFPTRRWYLIRVRERGAVISVSVDGRSLLHYADTGDPYRSGRVGLYTEDAEADYQVVRLSAAS